MSRSTIPQNTFSEPIENFLNSLITDKTFGVELNAEDLNEQVIDSIVDELSTALIQMIDGERKDSMDKRHVKPGKGKEEGVNSAKNSIDLFIRNVKKTLKKQLISGSISEEGCKSLRRAVANLNKQIKDAIPDNRTEFQTHLAGRVRHFCTLCLDNIRIKPVEKINEFEKLEAEKPEKADVANESKVEQQNECVRIFELATLNVITKQLSTLDLHEMTNGISKSRLENLAFELRLFAESVREESWGESELKKDSKVLWDHFVSVFRSFKEDISAFWRSRIELPKVRPNWFPTLLEPTDKDNNEVQFSYTLLSSTIAENLARIDKNQRKVSKTHREHLIQNDYLRMADKPQDLAILINDEFYAGVAFLSAEHIIQWLEENGLELAQEPSIQERKVGREIGGGVAETKKAGENLVRFSDPDDQFAYEKAERLLSCFHEGAGQNKFGPIIVGVILDLINHSHDSNPDLSNFLVRILRGITENIRLIRKARTDSFQKAVFYKEFNVENVYEAISKGLSTLDKTPSESAASEIESLKGLLAQALRKKADIESKLIKKRSELSELNKGFAKKEEHLNLKVQNALANKNYELVTELVAELSQLEPELRAKKDALISEISNLEKQNSKLNLQAYIERIRRVEEEVANIRRELEKV